MNPSLGVQAFPVIGKNTRFVNHADSMKPRQWCRKLIGVHTLTTFSNQYFHQNQLIELMTEAACHNRLIKVDDLLHSDQFIQYTH